MLKLKIYQNTVKIANYYSYSAFEPVCFEITKYHEMCLTYIFQIAVKTPAHYGGGGGVFPSILHILGFRNIKEFWREDLIPTNR